MRFVFAFFRAVAVLFDALVFAFWPQPKPKPRARVYEVLGKDMERAVMSKPGCAECDAWRFGR